MKGSYDKNGYIRVGLTRNDGKSKSYKVHRLVLLTFLPNPNSDTLQVNHIDGNKENNTLKNLEWVTCQENIEHAIKNKLRTGKEKSTLTDKDVHVICQYIEEGYAPKMIAQKLYPDDIDKYTSIIADIKRGKNWLSISKNYNLNTPYKYGENFKSKKYTIWELEKICDFLAKNKDKNGPTELAKIYFNNKNLKYNSPESRLFSQIIRKEKYSNVSKYYF